VTWNPTAVPASPSWRIRARLSDGTATTEVVSFPIIVSHAQTGETYDTVKPIVDRLCAGCHNPDGPLPLGPDFRGPVDLRLRAGLAWRKVAQLREMPPESASVVLPDAPPLTEEERTRLGEWLLAGAP
jgi:hypothetical protein